MLISRNTFYVFIVAIRLLCEEERDERSFYLNFAKDVLNFFVQDCKEHYGNTFFVNNVHRLLHITDHVEYFGLPLMKFQHFNLKIIPKVEASCLEEETI